MGLVSGCMGLTRAVVAAATLLLAAAPAMAETGVVPGRVNPYGLATYPDAARACPHLPRGQFARCVAQSDILNSASARARTSGKRVLVLVGADWCVWCVVLNRYINGWADPAMEPMAAGTADDADALARFVARNFVVAELNAETTDIEETLRRAQLTPTALRELPAAFVISHGAVQVIDFRRAELTKGPHKGYSRLALLRILRQSTTLAEADTRAVAD
jgi:thiol-disulfide isomerase/thioredoxin